VVSLRVLAVALLPVHVLRVRELFLGAAEDVRGVLVRAGGLRDLHTLFWIAKYVYRVREPEELIERARASEKVQAHVNGGSEQRVIVVPDKLVNIVV